MKQRLQLYLCDELVDFGEEEVIIPFTYTLEDFSNPTTIKNNFSKTVTLVGNDKNNKIFGEIYNFDREQLYGDSITGVNFNPSKRNPFKIFRNSELIEEGYFQLTSITKKGEVIKYNINLYGGLGDFFYSLKYNEDNQPLTMGDINYNIRDSYGNPIKDNSFVINKEFVDETWNQIENYNGKKIENFITFVPSYNGISDSISADKVLINAANSSVFPNTAKSNNGTTYSLYGGYALGKLNKSYNEWEIGDLRSYLQRPALRLSKFINAICDKDNNGGYEVELDKSFFNNSNPYYADAYITLPLLTSLKKTGEDIVTFETMQETTDFDGYVDVYSDEDAITFDSDTNIVTINEYTAKTTINVDFSFIIPKGYFTADKYYIAWRNKNFLWTDKVSINYFLFAEILDTNNNVLYTSQTYQLNGRKKYVEGDDNGNIQYYGYWQRNSDGSYVYTTFEGGSNTFRFTFNDISGLSDFKIRLKYKLYDGALALAEEFKDDDMVVSKGLNVFNFSIAETESYIRYGENIGTNTRIKFSDLLKTEKTPADFLLDYAKTFGLYFVKVNGEKKIQILTRNNFFRGNVIDWSDKVDKGKDMTITPLIFDKKFFSLVHPTPTTRYSQMYHTDYSRQYGEKLLNTNFNFNSDTNEIYKDSVFENVVCANDTSQYFRTFYNKNGYRVPSFMTDGVNYTRFSTSREEFEETLYANDYVDYTKTRLWTDTAGYDFFPKACFYQLNNNEQSLSEVQSTLLIYNGMQQLGYDNDTEEYYGTMYLTDDVKEMYTLNDDACYLYTESEYNVKGEKIAIELSFLPQFIRYKIGNNNVITHSLDYGVPKEMYMQGVEYPAESTLYNKCWSGLYNEQLNINNKKLNTYVLLDNVQVGNDMFRDFYYFDNAVWLLNKITNYNTNGYGSTACEFIRIVDTTNYTSGQNIGCRYFEYSDNNIPINANGDDVTVSIYTNVDWELDSLPSYITNYQEGTDYLRFTFGANNTYSPRTLVGSVKIFPEFDGGLYEFKNIIFKQPPQKEKAVKAYGYVKYSDGTIPQNCYIDAYRTDSTYNIYNRGLVDPVTGYYEVYVPNALNFTLQIFDNNSSRYTSTFTGIRDDWNKNFTIVKLS